MATQDPNIRPEGFSEPSWDPADPGGSLERVRHYVELEVLKSIGWYWANKKWKARLSRTIQLSALTFTALAGLVPIIQQIWPEWFGTVSGLWSSLLVGLAAALLGLDKAFGFSSGWARYVLAATSLRVTLEAFRVDWSALAARTSVPPTAEQIEALIERAKTCLLAAEGVVLQETKDWITEFQSNLAQFERSVRTQLETLSAADEKAAEQRGLAKRPGAIELSVSNAEGGLEVVLAGADGVETKENVESATSWAKIGVAPGQYKLRVRSNGAHAREMVVQVNPGETARPAVDLGG